MYKSIVMSCNTYYYNLANDLGIDAIHDFMKPFGFGQLTGVDLDSEKRGVLPSTEWKRNNYKKPDQQKWYAGETISVGIGQGYNSFTPLQLAHAVANLANNGVVMKPHLVKIIEDGANKTRKLMAPKESFRIALKQENIDFVKNAMVGVTKEGTSSRAFAGATYISGGKTGTAQAAAMSKSVKYDASKINERLRDHSLYIAFAPADNPRIALAIIVENAGFGAATAAPIARQAIDYYLLGKRPVEPEPVVDKGAVKTIVKTAVKTDAPAQPADKASSAAGATPGKPAAAPKPVPVPATTPMPQPVPAPVIKPIAGLPPAAAGAGKTADSAARSAK
jgi:penicillin-binding protein 2